MLPKLKRLKEFDANVLQLNILILMMDLFVSVLLFCLTQAIGFGCCCCVVLIGFVD